MANRAPEGGAGRGGAPGGSPPAPTGRDVTVAALVAAATELFAARGPDAVSLREVAAAAGVNYGLIHQYVGSKDDLLRLVLRSVSEDAAASFTEAGDPGAALDRLLGSPDRPATYVRMLAWALLQGRDPTELLGRSPALGALIGQLPVTGADATAAGGPDGQGGHDPRVLVAAVAAMALGWRLFGPFVQAGVGLEDADPSRMADEVRDIARRLVMPDPGIGRADPLDG